MNKSNIILATSNLEPWTIYVGSPAKPVKKRIPTKKMLKGIKNLEKDIILLEK